jgi:SAM-dependent methyltransferase
LEKLEGALRGQRADRGSCRPHEVPQQSGAALEFPDNNFDAVVSCLTFHEIADVPHKSDGVVEALRGLRPGGRYVFLDLFGDPTFSPPVDRFRDIIGETGASIEEFVRLDELLPLKFPFRHSKVLGQTVVIVGVRP